MGQGPWAREAAVAADWKWEVWGGGVPPPILVIYLFLDFLGFFRFSIQKIRLFPNIWRDVGPMGVPPPNPRLVGRYRGLQVGGASPPRTPR